MPSRRSVFIGLTGAVILGAIGGGLILLSLLPALTSIFLLRIGLVGMFRPRVVRLRSRWIAAVVASSTIPCSAFALDDAAHGLEGGPVTLTIWLFVVSAVASVRFLRRNASENPSTSRSNQPVVPSTSDKRS